MKHCRHLNVVSGMRDGFERLGGLGVHLMIVVRAEVV
jgi:hypothetical protein